MKKNVAGQRIGAQLVSASDGSAFTSAVTVYVTGDAGTQAIGSVGSGACAHEGNGYHTYAPAQAETNYDLAAFTFIGSGAVPATVQVFTSFPQTGDSFARIGAPVGASISADVAAVQADTDNIQTRIPAALVSGRIDASVGAMAADVLTAAATASDFTTEIQSGLATATNLATVAGYLDTEIAAILADTNELQTDWANGGRLDLILDARASQTSVDDLPTNAELATALGTADDAVLAAIAALSIPTVGAIADQVWDEVISGHAGVGSTGAALSAAGGSGDPWSTALPGAYGAGTAGQIVGDYLDAAVSDVPTAIENADALLNRDMSAVSDTNSRSPLNALRVIRNGFSISGTTLTALKEDDTTAAYTRELETDPAAQPITGVS